MTAASGSFSLRSPRKDLRVALVQAVVQIAPELLLHGFGGGEDFFQGAQDGVSPPDLRQGPLGWLGISSRFPVNASELVRVPREQLHEAVRSLHVPVRALLRRRHSDWLDRLWGWSCLRRFSLRRLLALGSRWPRCRHTFRGFGLVLASGRAASSLGGRLGHSSRRRRRRRLWGRLHRRWSRLRGGSPLALAPRAPLAPARARRQHFPPFPFKKILVFVVQKNRKGNAGAPGVYHVAVHVCQFEAQITQSNRAVEPHEMSLVGSPLSIMSLQMMSCPRGPLISAAFASVEHLKKSSL